MNTRTLFIIWFLVFGISAVYAQKISENKIPQDVIISFKYKYPDAEVSSWELNKDIYIAKFKLNEQEGKAELTDKGVWNVTKYPVAEKELPTPILNYFKDNYRSKEFSISVSELAKDNTGSTFYYLLLRKEGYNQMKPVELNFDLSGKLISKTDPEDNKTKGTIKEDKIKEEKVKKDDKQNNQLEPVIVADDNQKYIIDVSKVPATAKTHFISKVKKATGSVWYFQNKIYTVKFNLAGKNGQSTYAKDGTWIETRVDQSPETLHQLIVAYLKDNYRNFKIKTVELVSQTKDKSIFITMFDKRSKETPPPLTEIWFSTTGKFLSVNKAEEIDPYEISDKKRQEEKDNEFLSDVDKKFVTYENADNYNDKVDFKELPAAIPLYLKQYYKEHLVKSSRLVSDDVLGNVYLITVRAEDTKYSVHLYFDLQGKFLKKIDEAEGKINKDNNKTIEQTKVSEKPASKYGTPDESVNPKDLPANINKYLKKNYPQHTIAESYFKTDNDDFGNCYLLILKKSGEKKVVKLFFDQDGNMLKNETENL